MQDFPKIISVDDHVLEPPNLFERIPQRYRDRAPRLERRFGTAQLEADRGAFVEGDAPGARWCDVWRYEDLEWTTLAGYAQDMLIEKDLAPHTLVTYDDLLPGCYAQSHRLEDMDINHVEAALCFPTFARFCGQTFAERADKELALVCLQAYNDWMIEDWCGGAGAGRLIPLTLVPLWDAELAAAEVRRCAEKGAGAIAFSENPAKLGLPSIHSGYWDPLFQACGETSTVVNMHIGSSSHVMTTSADAPLPCTMTLTNVGSMGALADWLTSGVLVRFPDIRIVLNEGQMGWMPFLLERVDDVWERAATWEPAFAERVPERPSSYMNRVYGCIMNDPHALASRDVLGMSQIMFEIDYPHAESTFPHSRETAEKLVANAGLSEHEAWQFVRGNAIECYGLTRFGIKP